ncbi:MAG: glutathione S-transferase family protein [Alphaproteobacteria bacterium]
MDYELFWISGSPYGWMAMLAMEVKKLSYVSHRLDPSKTEHKAPDYLAINPRGKVPALKNGDMVVYESIAILNYLDRMHPEPALFGETPRDTGLGDGPIKGIPKSSLS